DRLGDPPKVFSVDDLVQAGDDMGFTVVAKFDHDPATAHLVSDGPRRAGASEAVENEVTGIGSDSDDPTYQPLGFWRRKRAVFPEECAAFLLGFIRMSHILMRPPRPRN